MGMFGDTPFCFDAKQLVHVHGLNVFSSFRLYLAFLIAVKWGDRVFSKNVSNECCFVMISVTDV